MLAAWACAAVASLGRVRNADEAWPNKLIKLETVAERTQLLLRGREGGTEEPPTPAEKPQECVGPAACSTHFMLF